MNGLALSKIRIKIGQMKVIANELNNLINETETLIKSNFTINNLVRKVYLENLSMDIYKIENTLKDLYKNIDSIEGKHQIEFYDFISPNANNKGYKNKDDVDVNINIDSEYLILTKEDNKIKLSFRMIDKGESDNVILNLIKEILNGNNWHSMTSVINITRTDRYIFVKGLI